MDMPWGMLRLVPPWGGPHLLLRLPSRLRYRSGVSGAGEETLLTGSSASLWALSRLGLYLLGPSPRRGLALHSASLLCAALILDASALATLIALVAAAVARPSTKERTFPKAVGHIPPPRRQSPSRWLRDTPVGRPLAIEVAGSLWRSLNSCEDLHREQRRVHRGHSPCVLIFSMWGQAPAVIPE